MVGGVGGCGYRVTHLHNLFIIASVMQCFNLPAAFLNCKGDFVEVY